MFNIVHEEKIKSYRIGTTLEFVNDDRIFFFAWTKPMRFQCAALLKNYNETKCNVARCGQLG